MKTLLVTLGTLALTATAAHAGDFKVEYNENATTAAKSDKSDTVKTEFNNFVFGDTFRYSVEANLTQANNKGAVSGQLIAKAGAVVPVGFLTLKPRVEYGTVEGLGKASQFYGLDGQVTSKTPIQPLTVTLGYRQRFNGNGGIGNRVTREEVSAEYAVTKKYGVGLAYYHNSGDSTSNVLGAYVKAKF